MKKIRRLTIISIIIVYIVILAGATVRMTGSGMGCPDWPKCFGYLIPPTDRSDIEWKKNHNYKKNQIIIFNDSLIYANKDFKSSTYIGRENWSNYTKHDYSKFNVYHTWIEYINRLIGAIAGLSVLILFINSLKFIIKTENLKLLQHGYDVTISTKRMVEFSSMEDNIKYWVAAEHGSVYCSTGVLYCIMWSGGFLVLNYLRASFPLLCS